MPSQAESVGVTGAYKAWLWLGSVSPATRFTHSDGPYILPNGVKIADNWDNSAAECGGYTSTSGGHYWANLRLFQFANGCSGASCASSAPLICFQQ